MLGYQSRLRGGIDSVAAVPERLGGRSESGDLGVADRQHARKGGDLVEDGRYGLAEVAFP